ncbi:hypothetical protein [Catenuloplanes indicus]|uniref:Uncharacterized protein n=1 Tax=Catenuloplanes indicus TaxID=137267 RepID=A0AAE4AVL0_9ACTN|nr:hypothetical protein [Catenuloplanes indicus]MDQ0365025.1 hypothetical protein [Catenuloplanes indicus]
MNNNEIGAELGLAMRPEWRERVPDVIDVVAANHGQLTDAVRNQQPLHLSWNQRDPLFRKQPHSATLPGVPNNKGE